jgi:hypothetical protein
VATSRYRIYDERADSMSYVSHIITSLDGGNMTGVLTPAMASDADGPSSGLSKDELSPPPVPLGDGYPDGGAKVWGVAVGTLL